jgi:hypothetical protein
VGGLAAAGADALAVNGKWLAVRRHSRRYDTIEAFRLETGGEPGRGFRVARVRTPSQLSRPALSGNKIVYALAKAGTSSLVRGRLRKGSVSGLRRIASSRTLLFAGPSMLGPKVAYIATSRRQQTVRVKGLGKGLGRTVYRRGAGPPTLWTTALAADRVLFTQVAKGGAGKLLSVGRR